MIQRGELAGDLEGFGVTDRDGRHQTDVMRGGRQRRKNGQRFETIEVMRAGFFMNVQAVGDKHEIEFRGFRQLRLLLIEVEIDAGIGQGLRMAPFAPAVADAMNHCTEFQLALLAHGCTPVGVASFSERQPEATAQGSTSHRPGFRRGQQPCG